MGDLIDLDVFESDSWAGEDFGFGEFGDDESSTFNESSPFDLDREREAEAPLAILWQELEDLRKRSKDIIYDEGDCEDTMICRKLCATRHGCTGATNCNYDYASYPG